MSIQAGSNTFMISQIHTKQPQLLPHAASKTIPTKSRDCLHRTCSNFQKQLDRQRQNGTEHTGLRDVLSKLNNLTWHLSRVNTTFQGIYTASGAFIFILPEV